MSIDRINAAKRLVDRPIRENRLLSLPDKKLLAKQILSEKKESRQLELIRLASAIRLSDDSVAEVVSDLLASGTDPMEMVYKKRYHTPEVVPQQYASRMNLVAHHKEWVDVYYLLDQMVGYRFQNGETFAVGDKIKV
jgi:hypothetical protein